MAFAGLDIGTSGCKMVVYDLDGKILFQASEKYQELGEDGYREIDPTEVLVNVKKTMKEVGENCPVAIEAMAVTSLGESVVFMDKKGTPLCNSMVTGDKRGILETQRLIEAVGAEKILEITGLPPSEMYGLPKYMWVNENTDVVQKAEYITFYEDFAGFILTGRRMVSYSSASRSMAFDIERKCWSEELLAYAGITSNQMSEPVEAGTVIGRILPEIADELKLNPDMIVVAGGHDQSCAALGSGLNSTETGECGMGTCEFTFMMLPGPEKSSYMIENDLTCVPYVLPGTYLTSLEITTCGILKNWSRDTILEGLRYRFEQEGKVFFEEIDKLIDGKETNVMVLPQFGSSGNPDINYDVSGTICGLTIHTRPEEIYQAILEGMAFQTLLGFERSRKIGTGIRRLICTGGGSKSRVTLQMRADIMDMDVASIHSEESGTLGCMILAAVAAGAFQSVEDAIRKVVHIKEEFRPNKERQAYYREKYQRFKKLYEIMHLF